MAEKENIKDKLENLKEGHRKSNKDIIESLFAILGYLKNNTDVDNPTSQTQMRKVEEISEYLGTKSTFHNKMVNMAIALDSADGVTLNEKRECRLMFDSIDALIKEYESDEYFDDDDDETDPCRENKLCERYILQSPIFKKRGHRSYKCRENVKGDRRG